MTPPRTRADCENGPRPCPWAACRHWLPGGACALDVAATGPVTLAEIAAYLGVTRERVRQIEAQALSKIRRRAPWLAVALESSPKPARSVQGWGSWRRGGVKEDEEARRVVGG